MNTQKQQPEQEILKDQQKEIIDSLLRFRYLNRLQIQTMLHHKSWKRIILWLNDLTEKHYLFRFYTRNFAGKQSEYCLDTASIGYLKNRNINEALLKKSMMKKHIH